jgi:hypothetical protein
MVQVNLPQTFLGFFLRMPVSSDFFFSLMGNAHETSQETGFMEAIAKNASQETKLYKTTVEIN